MPRQPRPVVLVERKRIWEIFCAYRGEDNGAPFGDRAYTSFRPYHLLQFLKAQPGLRSAWTRKRWATYIQCAANEAARMGVIERNPFQGLRLPMGKQGRDWTDDEYRALLRHADPHFRRFICFLRFSGARPGEASAAKWSDWDRDTNTVVLREHKTSHTTSEPRRIRLNHVTVKLLAWIERYAVRRPHIFLNYFDRPWTTHSLCKHMRAQRRRAGLSEEVRLHGGRHCFATRGLMNGVELATMAALLGHKDVTMTMRYTHVLSKANHMALAAEMAVSTNGHAPPLQTLPAPQMSRLIDAPAIPPANGASPSLEAFIGLLLQRLSPGAVPAPASVKKRKPRPTKLTRPHAAAYRQYLEVVQKCPDLTMDYQVYDWLVKHGRKMVAFTTWVRYLGHARRFHDTRKRVLSLEPEPEQTGPVAYEGPSEVQASPAPVPHRPPIVRRQRDAIEKAWTNYQWALQQQPDLKTDVEIFAFLQGQPDRPYRLPQSASTFRAHIIKARHLHGCHKRTRADGSPVIYAARHQSPSVEGGAP